MFALVTDIARYPEFLPWVVALRVRADSDREAVADMIVESGVGRIPIVDPETRLVVGILSYVPFSAPVGMPLRLFLGTAAWWEPLVSLAILTLTTVLIVMLGARIYERTLLKLGARVGWREALTR